MIWASTFRYLICSLFSLPTPLSLAEIGLVKANSESGKIDWSSSSQKMSYIRRSGRSSGMMTEAKASEIGWLHSSLCRVGLVVLIGMSSALPIRAASLAEERPSPIAPYRYTSPPTGTLDSLEQQKAFSYRNELAAQRRLQQLNRMPGTGAASSLRSQGDLNRETRRIDQVLQR